MNVTVAGKNRLGLYGVLAALLAFAACGCEDTSAPQGPTRRKGDAERYDKDYIAALAAADEFCHAWQKGHFRDAKALMTRRLTRQYPETQLVDAVVGISNPVHFSYEIFDGEKLIEGQITFKVRLFRLYSGQMHDRIEGDVQQIVMVKDENRAWRVDDFPIPRAK